MSGLEVLFLLAITAAGCYALGYFHSAHALHKSWDSMRRQRDGLAAEVDRLTRRTDRAD